MPGIPELTSDARSGVANIVLERERLRVGSGSGFLTDRGLVTAWHVVGGSGYDTVRVRFDDESPNSGMRFARQDFLANPLLSSPEDELDVVLVPFDEPETTGRHRFGLSDRMDIAVGTQVLVLGFPYDKSQLACHVAYISASFDEGPVRVFQIDGSINLSNSGGPVVAVESGHVVAYVTRTETGLFRDFDELVRTLEENVAALSQPSGARISIGGLDPHQAFLATMRSLHQVAANMRRSANVGIGYAFSAHPLVDVEGHN